MYRGRGCVGGKITFGNLVCFSHIVGCFILFSLEPNETLPD